MNMVENKSRLAAVFKRPFDVAVHRVHSSMDMVSDLISLQIDALSGHWMETEERIAVARKARNVFELVSDQIDLLPETQARMRKLAQKRGAIIRRQNPV